jgi:hypothetical protein
VELHLHQGAWGASSIRVPKKNARCPGLRALRAKAMRGVAALAPLFPVRPGGERPLLFTGYPQALSNVEEENLSCARDQVVIARPPVLTPPWRYRRSLVSKGRFANTHQRDLRGNLFRPSEKAWRFSQKNDWIVQVIPQQATKAIPVLSTRKIVTRRQKLERHFLLRC